MTPYSKTRNTCTNFGWNVSVQTGSHMKPTLSVFKFHGKNMRLLQKGSGYGKVFETSEDAWEWAYEHGFIREWFSRRNKKRRK